jgi:hypothetical protein
MYLPTTLFISFLAITPAFSASVPNSVAINSNALVARGVAQQSLHTRNDVYGLDLDAMMHKRDILEHLVARKNKSKKSKKNKGLIPDVNVSRFHLLLLTA